MDSPRVHYLRCPYCGGDEGGHEQRQPKGVGKFIVKELYNNVLIFECQKCKKVFRKQSVGSVLTWADMTPTERKAFNQEQYIKYKEVNDEQTIQKNTRRSKSKSNSRG